MSAGKDFHIPELIMTEFAKNPRVIIKPYPAGLWPIDIAILKNPEFLKKLVNDPAFTKKYDIVIVEKE